MEIKVNLLRELKKKESILICGLPGIAHIGKLSVDYLVQELKAELVGEIYSRFFPPYVLIKKDGIVELLRNELHYLDRGDEKSLFFLTGNTQAFSPEGQYEMTDKILDVIIQLGVKRIFSIAAILTDRSFDSPKVYGTTTNASLIEEIKRFGVLPMTQGNISGTNGLMFGLAKIKNLEGICLLGETRGYQTGTGEYLIDSKAARAVLEVLTNMLNVKVDMGPLDKQTEHMEELIKRIEGIEGKVQDEMREMMDKSRTSYIT